MIIILLFMCLRYSCDCSHTAFTGRYCEIPLPPCHSQPCFNSAICENDQGNYTCKCWPGKTQDTTFKEQMRDEKCKERRICPKSSNYVTMAPWYSQCVACVYVQVRQDKTNKTKIWPGHRSGLFRMFWIEFFIILYIIVLWNFQGSRGVSVR